jgi:hypothetical protein
MYVLAATSQPYIFSNGYKIRFNEEPCPHCNLGYVVPEWVEENPTLSDIRRIYGATTLPTTTIVLPLKPDKVKPVKQQLSSIHPEVQLFLLRSCMFIYYIQLILVQITSTPMKILEVVNLCVVWSFL